MSRSKPSAKPHSRRGKESPSRPSTRQRHYLGFYSPVSLLLVLLCVGQYLLFFTGRYTLQARNHRAMEEASRLVEQGRLDQALAQRYESSALFDVRLDAVHERKRSARFTESGIQRGRVIQGENDPEAVLLWYAQLAASLDTEEALREFDREMNLYIKGVLDGRISDSEAGDFLNRIKELDAMLEARAQSIRRRIEGNERVVSIPGTSVTIELIWCPPGEFLMGSPETETVRHLDEGPLRQVRFEEGFWMGKYEVTQAQWYELTGSNPSKWRMADLPVENVSWNDCQRFIRNLNSRVSGGGFRLPSEAEWEYACRAGTTTRFHFGDTHAELENYAWFASNSDGRSQRVGNKSPNPWGLHDMHGNVWEWCQDWYNNSYDGAPVDGSAREYPSGSTRALRGGSLVSLPRMCRSACREKVTPMVASYSIGFRLVWAAGRDGRVKEPTPTPSSTPTHTQTSLPSTSTATPTRTPTSSPTSTYTPTRTPTSTQTPSFTRTFTSTNTFTFTQTPTRTPTPTPLLPGMVKEITIPGTSIKIELVYCPPGEFHMGSPMNEGGRSRDEGPRHSVRFTQGFWMGKTEVTQAQWQALMEGNPSRYRGSSLPVEQVSWDDCQEFVKRLNAKLPNAGFRLPSEAEWEYACRAGSAVAYCFGDDDGTLRNHAWYRDNSGRQTNAVGRKTPNAWNLHDMHGNVWEWCQDNYHRNYEGAPSDGRAWESSRGSGRVYRGGSWNARSNLCRSAQRQNATSDNRSNEIGLRLISIPIPEPTHTPTRTSTSPSVSTTMAPRDGSTVTIPGTSLSIEMVWVPSGSFLMGSPSSESGRYNDEGPQRRVTIANGFWLGKFEVTQAQWQAVMGSNPSNWKGANLPVERVSWNDCQEFIRKLNERVPGGGFRLPSEAEWEYACRAGSTTRFSFGDRDSDLGNYAWFTSNSSSRTQPVGQKRPNAWGLYDMHGNVYEWCADYYHDNYNGAPTDGSTRLSPTSSTRVLRGGSWHNFPWYCRSAYRDGSAPGLRSTFRGFRLARTP